VKFHTSGALIIWFLCREIQKLLLHGVVLENIHTFQTEGCFFKDSPSPLEILIKLFDPHPPRNFQSLLERGGVGIDNFWNRPDLTG